MENFFIGIQGETIPLYFNYKLNGTNIELVDSIKNIECQLLEEGATGSLKLTLDIFTTCIYIVEETGTNFFFKFTQNKY